MGQAVGIGGGGGGWTTALDLDFSAQDSQTLSANQSYTIGGYSWTKFNSANDSTAMAVTNGSGLVIVPAQSTDYNGATRTTPGLRLPLSSFMAAADYGMSLRVMAYVSASNEGANYDGFRVGIDSGSAVFGYMAYRGRTTIGNGFSTHIQVNSANPGYQNKAVTLGASNNCVMVEIPKLGYPELLVRHGQYSSGWPTVWTSASSYAALSTDLATFTLADMGLVIGAQRAGSVTAYSVTVARLRVDYRR